MSTTIDWYADRYSLFIDLYLGKSKSYMLMQCKCPHYVQYTECLSEWCRPP